MTPVGEETLSMRADVPVEGEYADKRREFFGFPTPNLLAILAFSLSLSAVSIFEVCPKVMAFTATHSGTFLYALR